MIYGTVRKLTVFKFSGKKSVIPIGGRGGAHPQVSDRCSIAMAAESGGAERRGCHGTWRNTQLFKQEC